MKERSSTMTVPTARRSCPRGPMYRVARTLCFVVLVWIGSTGLESPVAATAAVAKPIGRTTTGPSVVPQIHQTSGIPQTGKFGLAITTAAWQLPEGPIKKVLVIFEGLYVQPYEFWDRSPNCPMCTGLPEKRKIVNDAIARNYAVFIPHPLDLDGMREAPDGMMQALSPNSPDILSIVFILAEWKALVNLQHDVPMVALGVSSGGNVLSTLGLLPNFFESIAIMISNGVVEAFESASRDYPPTIFIHMPKDTDTAEMVYYDRKLLSSSGVPTKEVRWYEQSVTPEWFAELIPGMNRWISRKIHQHLREEGWLDEETGFLKPDIDFQYEWHAKVREWNILPPDPEDEEWLMFEDSLLEELNVAFAYHVTLARNNEDLFAWFEGGYKVQEMGGYGAMSLSTVIY